MPRSTVGIFRRLAIVAAGSALCVAAFGTAAGAGSRVVPRTATPVVKAADVLSLHSASGVAAVQSIGLNARMLIMDTARRAAAARAVAKRAAAARAVAAAAARQAAPRQTAAQQAAATQPPAQLTAQPSTAGSPQQIAQQMLGQYGWAGQFTCLDSLWMSESGWNIYAENPATGAYGIPQALPGSKMASAGPDWQSDPATQIRWGLDYIQASYGSPCAAWSHEEADGWY